GGPEGMELTSSPDRLRQALDQARSGGALVGFVPTMGDLHRGHAGLIDRARRECGFVAISVFVNPLQFDSKADLDAYPRRLAADLDMPVAVVGCPTARDPDGLALSSRNARLTPEERRAAPVLFEALSDAAALVRQGERRGDVLRAGMARRIGAERLARLDYVAVVDAESWEDVEVLERPARALAAVRIGDTRLIDNLLLPAMQ